MTSRRQRSLNVDRILGVIALLTILAAWVIGLARAKADIVPFLMEVIPEAERFESIGEGVYAAWENDREDHQLGYVKISSAIGWGGPIETAVGVNLNGQVIGIAIVDYKETPSFFKRVLSSSFISSFQGKAYNDDFVIGRDVDAVSGATRTSGAITASVRLAVRDIAQKRLGLSILEEEKVRVSFGIPEIVLMALYTLGLIGRSKSFKLKKAARWGSLIAGLLFLGILYNDPLTISMVNQVLLGFLPEWQTNLYWYLLIGGIALFFIVDNTNPYCYWFCPFGAAQECLGLLGNAKPRSPGRYRTLLTWLQRLLAWAAIVMALLFRNPGLSSYEVFGTFFGLVGSTIQFVLLGIVLVASLFILNPWCNYLCPIRPVDHFFRMTRRWMRESWQRRNTKKQTS